MRRAAPQPGRRAAKPNRQRLKGPAPEPLEHIVNRLKRDGVISPFARGSNTPRALRRSRAR